MSTLKVKNGNTWVSIPTIKGDQGDPGPGVPNGGTTGQILVKHSNTDQDTEWADITDIIPDASGVGF